MKKSLKITLIVAAVLAIIVLAVALLISPIAKNYIEKHSRELIGRPVTMQKLKINIFTGGLHITELNIGGAEDSTTFFTLADFDMKMRLLPLLSNRVQVDHITFVRPSVKVYQQGDKFNFDGILEHFQSDTTAVEEPSEPWEIGIYNITIDKGYLYYKDLLLNAEWGLNDIDLQIPGVYFGGEKTDVGAVLNFAQGGSLETKVAYAIDSDDFDIGIHLRDLTLSGMLPYFRQSLDITSVKGLLTADINLRGNSEHLLSMRADGTAQLTGFSLLDARQREVLATDTLRIALAEGDLQNNRFRFDKFFVSGFSTFYELTPTGDNFTDLLKPLFDTPEAPATEQTVASPAASLHIADLDIRNSRAVVRDLTLSKPFEYSISDIRMRCKDFNPDARNKFDIDARMQKTGSAKLRWDGSISDINNQNITLWLTNLDLRDFTPYCEHFTAYPLTNGNLTFRSQNVIRNRVLDGTNHLDVFEPKVDKKRKDMKPEMNIPLKLGLYVLKDKKGHVKMDLPVQGSLDSPEFSYRKIVLKAIGNVLLKVVTAPFSFLSGHKDNLEYINIEAQQYAFSSEQYASMDKIAQMLKDKPEMKIGLTQRINLQRALPQQAGNALRMAYHNSLQTADSTGARPKMSMLEYEKILAIDIRTPSVVAFADSLLRTRGLSENPASLSPDAKAMTLYREEAATQLARLMADRDKEVATYLQQTHALPTTAFSLIPADSAARQSYTGRDRYTLSIEVDGETVEVASETPAEGVAGAANSADKVVPAAPITPATPAPAAASTPAPVVEAGA